MSAILVAAPLEPTPTMVEVGMVAAQLESVAKPFLWSDAVRAAYRAMIVARNLTPEEPAA